MLEEDFSVFSIRTIVVEILNDFVNILNKSEKGW